MNKEAYYFSHDSNARNDVKIIRLRRVLEMEGYGIYFALIEMLREQSDHKLPLSSLEDIAYDLRVSKEKVSSVILNFDLFEIEDEDFFSARLLRSMNKYNETKSKLSEAGKKGNEKRWGTQLSLPDSPPDSPPNRIKGKESKENKIKVFIPPTLDDVINYCREKGYTDELATKAFNYYQDGDWKDGNGKQVLSWKQKLIANWFKDEYKIQDEAEIKQLKMVY